MIMYVLCLVVHMRTRRRRGVVAGWAGARQRHALIVDATVHNVNARMLIRVTYRLFMRSIIENRSSSGTVRADVGTVDGRPELLHL